MENVCLCVSLWGRVVILSLPLRFLFHVGPLWNTLWWCCFYHTDKSETLTSQRHNITVSRWHHILVYLIGFSSPHPPWPCNPLVLEWFLMVWWSPTIELFSLIHHNCKFVSMINHDVKIWYTRYVFCEWVLQHQRGRDLDELLTSTNLIFPVKWPVFLYWHTKHPKYQCTFIENSEMDFMR